MTAREEIREFAKDHLDMSYADISRATGRSGAAVTKALVGYEPPEVEAERRRIGKAATRRMRPDRLDPLTGRKFGRLTIVGVTGDARYRTVRCDCGAVLDVRLDSLKEGTIWRCSRGCPVDTGMVPGARFGMLTLLEVSKPPETPQRRGTTVWRCRCDCGNECELPERYISKRQVTSCGCIVAKRSREGRGLFDGTSLAHLTSKRPSNNTSGVKGVSWDKSKGAWRASIRFKGVEYHLGRYRSIEEAADARRDAEINLFDPILERYGWDATDADGFRESLRDAVAEWSRKRASNAKKAPPEGGAEGR